MDHSRVRSSVVGRGLWHGNRVGDALALPVGEASVDYVVCGLVLNFIPDPAAALAEMCRVAVDGTTIAGYVWDYSEGIQLIRRSWDAAIALNPAAADLDEATRFPLCRQALCIVFSPMPAWVR